MTSTHYRKSYCFRYNYTRIRFISGICHRSRTVALIYIEGPYESESYVTTDGQPASLSWSKVPIWGLRPDLYYMCDSYSLVLVGRPL
jgi:hypothetical protein